MVYGESAMAVPLRRPKAEATVSQAPGGRPAAVELKDFKIRWPGKPRAIPPEVRPFARIIQACVKRFPEVPAKGWKLTVRSQIPSGCGLGSGTAVSAAAFRAIFRYFNVPHTAQTLSEMVYEIEKLHHGTPSGIDNTVISMGRPILFRRGAEAQIMAVPRSRCFLVIGHTGKRHSTSAVVSAVARARAAQPARYNAIFREIGLLSKLGAKAFEKGLWRELGLLMNRNQDLLERLGVSSPELDALVQAARSAGVLGAKLSGAGRGGCMAALTNDPACARRTRRALRAAGAAETFLTGLCDHERA